MGFFNSVCGRNAHRIGCWSITFGSLEESFKKGSLEVWKEVWRETVRKEIRRKVVRKEVWQLGRKFGLKNEVWSEKVRKEAWRKELRKDI